MKIIIFEEIGSTNDYLKTLDTDEDTVVIAQRQLGGRGSKGRSFDCQRGGTYLSVLKIHPCDAKDAFTIMQNSALAVIHTLSAFDIKGQIKWPNDIFVNGKKICGILIENTFSGHMISRSIVGVGLNVNNLLSDELKDIAISMKEVLGQEVNLDAVRSTLIYNLFREFDQCEYKKHSLILNKEVTIVTEKATYKAIIDDILPDGRIKTEDGKILSSAEVTIR